MASPTARSALLFVVIIALFVVIGAILGEVVFNSALAGLIIALGLSLAINLVSYFWCDRFVLWANKAKVVSDSEAPRLAKIVHELAPQFGLVAPRIAIIPTQTPNAFATGRNEKRAVVAATEGILRLLDDRELRGVIAHELAHVKDRDILLMTLAATLAGAISYAAQIVIFSQLLGGRRSNVNPIILIVAAIGAPIGAMLIQLAISRSRESHADEVGARTIRDPLSLADALGKLEAGNARRPLTTGSPASSSLYIVNPFRGSSFANLFSTHPPIAKRIAALREMAANHDYVVSVRSPSFAPSAPSWQRGA